MDTNTKEVLIILLQNILSFVFVIVTPIIMYYVNDFLKTKNLEKHNVLVNAIITDSIAYAEQFAIKSLKDGKKTTGKEKFEEAFAFVQQEYKRYNLGVVVKDEVQKLIESRILPEKQSLQNRSDDYKNAKPLISGQIPGVSYPTTTSDSTTVTTTTTTNVSPSIAPPSIVIVEPTEEIKQLESKHSMYRYWQFNLAQHEAVSVPKAERLLTQLDPILNESLRTLSDLDKVFNFLAVESLETLVEESYKKLASVGSAFCVCLDEQGVDQATETLQEHIQGLEHLHTSLLTQVHTLQTECTKLLRQSPKTADSSLLRFVSHNIVALQEGWPSVSQNLTASWLNWSNMSRLLLDDLLMKFDPTTSKVLKASGLLKEANQTLLSARLEGLAEAVYKLAEQDLYVGDIGTIDLDTKKHLLQMSMKDQEMSHVMSNYMQEEDPVYLAVLNPEKDILSALKSLYAYTEVHSPYDYLSFRLGFDCFLIAYQNHLLSNRLDVLQTIQAGNIRQMREKAAKLTIPARVAKTERLAAVIRCTFTSNARFDPHFLDYMRSKGATKTNANTWDVPYAMSQDLKQLQSELKFDWGFPFCYELIETPGSVGKIFNDIGTGGDSRLAWAKPCMRLVRTSCSPKVTGNTVSAENYPTKVFPTKEAAVAYTNKLTEAVESCAASSEVDLTIVEKLNKAADFAPDGQRLKRIASELLVRKHLVFFDSARYCPNQASVLLAPTVESTVYFGSTKYFVLADDCSQQRHAWFVVESSKDASKFIVTKPDANSNVGLLPVNMSVPRSMHDAYDTYSVPVEQAFNMPTYLLINFEDSDENIDGTIIEPPDSLYRPDEDSTSLNHSRLGSKYTPMMPVLDPLKPNVTVLYFPTQDESYLVTRPLREDENNPLPYESEEPVLNMQPYYKKPIKLVPDGGQAMDNIESTEYGPFRDINLPENTEVDESGCDPMVRLKKYVM